MAKQDFLPRREGDFIAWYDNFKTQFALIATTLGFGAGDITSVTNKNTAIHTDMTAATVKKADAETAVAVKRATIESAIDQARKLAARAKTHQNYTEAYGRQLGIIAPEEVTALAADKPDLKAEMVQNGNVVIGFFKGDFDGMLICSKRGSETEFTPLARDTHSPYVDNRPNLQAGVPETRYYVGQYLDGDEPVGPISDILQVTVPAK